MRSLALLALVGISSFLLNSCSSESGRAVTRTYEMGVKAQVGQFGYTVFERQWLTQLGEPGSAEARVPQNRFLLLRISVLNSGGATLSVPNLKVVDDHGKSFDENTNGDGVPQYIGSLREVKPGDTIQGNVLFDVPPQHYKIAVTDEDSKETAYIDLPLSFDSTATDVPEAPAKKQ